MRTRPVHTQHHSSKGPPKSNVTQCAQQGDQIPQDSKFSARFNDWDTLKFSLRSVEKFASWVRNVYIVTNGQVRNGYLLALISQGALIYKKKMH